MAGTSEPAAAVDVVSDRPGLFHWEPAASVPTARRMAERVQVVLDPCTVTIQGRHGAPVERWRFVGGRVEAHTRWDSKSGGGWVDAALP